VVTLLNASSGSPAVIGQATSDAAGTFEIGSPIIQTSSIFYVTASVAPGITFMAVVGENLPSEIRVNELTTVAAVFCAAQLIVDGEIRGQDSALRIASGMNANLVWVSTGESSPVLLRSPNADETNALRSTRSLANLISLCIRDGQSEAVFQATQVPNTPPVTDTIQALFNIARYPANQVQSIYDLSGEIVTFEPALAKPPDAWTLAVKVNDSGDDAHPFGGPANLVFDANGYAWITNNVVQGQPYSTEWCIVLRPDGSAARVATGAPMNSPFTGSGLLGAGFGVDIDSKGRIWIGDFGWGDDPAYIPAGTVSLFDALARPIPPDGSGYTKDVNRVQATVVDGDDNVWLASYGNNRVVVYPGGDPARVTYKQCAASFVPFGIAIAADGTAWVTNSDAAKGGVAQFALSGTEVQLRRTVHVGRTVKGIAIDSVGNIWLGAGGDNLVYHLDRFGTVVSSYQGGGLDGPWGVCLDGKDNLWAANFGPLRKDSTDYSGRLTCLAGANNPDGLRIGTPISPESGYTLPTAGEQVLLHDGTPLYGPGADPCLIPMMRTTGVNVDQAGNVWTCNNWKPDFDTDRAGNPGGDGMVIFIGLATPPKL
jgi:hypothetical protein